jgi:hypothetical protein
MARGPSTFKQGDVTRALRAAFAAGAQSVRVEVDKDGRIVVIASKTDLDLTISSAPDSEIPEDVKRLI